MSIVIVSLIREYLRGKYHCTIDLLFDWLGISCMTTDNFCFYLQNRLIQTSQTGGQWYSDTFPFSIPCFDILHRKRNACMHAAASRVENLVQGLSCQLRFVHGIALE
jgi:hypothetical protein